MGRIFKKAGIRNHPDYNLFIDRYIKALYREKFNRVTPLNNTPRSGINTSKYIIEIDKKSIFISTPNFLFEELLNALFIIARKEQNEKISAIKLFKKVYNNNEFRNLKPNWENYSWTKNFDVFYANLIEESFFYFDDLQNQYYFNLFRNIKDEAFEGGILHALARHFDDFTKFHPKPDGRFDFQYNTFLSRLIDCCINGIIIGDKIDKGYGNFVINKEIKVWNKKMRVGLYWENTKSLFFLNTVLLKSK